MASADSPIRPERSARPPQRRLGWIAVAVVGLLLLGALGFVLSRQAAPAVPAALAHDPVLARGYEIYALRCTTCHGEGAHGDGPTAARLAGAKPRDLVADEWRYGDTAEAALRSVAQGYPGSGMPAYQGLYGAADLKAVTAYTLHLAERAVPQSLRVP